jgi:hypothetical protein
MPSPILMTTLAAAPGLLPLAIGKSDPGREIGILVGPSSSTGARPSHPFLRSDRVGARPLAHLETVVCRSTDLNCAARDVLDGREA